MVWVATGGVAAFAIVVLFANELSKARHLGEVTDIFRAVQRTALRNAAVSALSPEGTSERKRSPASRRTSRDLVVTYGIAEEGDDHLHEVTITARRKPQKYVAQHALMAIMELKRQLGSVAADREPDLGIGSLATDSHVIRFRLDPTQQEQLQALVASSD
jgi:hypothetical protein